MKYSIFENRINNFLKTYKIENREQYALDIYTIEDINRFDYISDIINRVKQIKVE